VTALEQRQAEGTPQIGPFHEPDLRRSARLPHAGSLWPAPEHKEAGKPSPSGKRLPLPIRSARLPQRAWIKSGSGRLRARQAAVSVLASRQAIVMGPTPPGTGVMAPATSTASSKATSPT